MPSFWKGDNTAELTQEIFKDKASLLIPESRIYRNESIYKKITQDVLTQYSDELSHAVC